MAVCDELGHYLIDFSRLVPNQGNALIQAWQSHQVGVV